MGLLDFLRSKDDRKRDLARDIDVLVGALERCPVCGDVMDKGHAGRMPAAEAEANARFDRDDASVALFAGNRDALIELLHEVRDMADFECSCDKGG